MKVLDLNQFGSDGIVETDLCIIGSGPAGMSIANEFAATHTRVLVLEGGGLELEQDTQALYEILNTGAPRVMDSELVRTRVLGGSSHVWTGRCAPFDEWDYEHRAWVPYSGWPLTRRDLEPYVTRATPYLGLAAHPYDESLWRLFKVDPPRPALHSPFLRPMFWQFSKSPGGPAAAHFGREWADSEAPNIEILLHANLTHINLSADATRFDSVDVASLGGKRARIRAKAAVLCCGGIENARVLLASNRVCSAGVGNQHDMVGRFLMDHTSGPCGSFPAERSSGIRDRFGHYWVDDDRGRHVYLHGVGLTPEVMKQEGLLNCHAYLEQFDPNEDAWTALKRLRSSFRSRRFSGRDVRQVLGNLGPIGRGLYRRRFRHRPQLESFKRVELFLMLEQMPDPDSRVTLSVDKTDALGMPLSQVHWKIGELERRTARRMLQLFVEACKQLRLPVPQGIPPLEDLNEWISRCTEKAHPTGATRMSVDPRAGVVDINCQVHGVNGLFVSGSSVFPTAGAANPTLMIVATALRLADHLKTQLGHTGAMGGGASTPELRTRYGGAAPGLHAASATRIGLVGASRRITDVYLPIMRHMPEQYAIVGFTTFSAQGFRRFESQTGIRSYSNPAELLEKAKPELLILAVPDRLNEAVLNDLLDLGVPILAETPVAWTVSGTQRLIEKAAAHQVLLGVAEQFPVLPLEQFRARLLDTGILGDIYAARNDFQSYSYHAIAQLRRYLKGRPSSARSTEHRFPSSPDDGSGSRWQSGSVIFDDGSLLVHNYAYPARGHPGSIGLYGTLGAMQNSDIRCINSKTQGAEGFPAVRTENSAGTLASISAQIPGIGCIEWENPLAAYPFSDEAIAVATNLNGMRRALREGLVPHYTARDFLVDIGIIQAFRYSLARSGAQIRLPLQESQQKLLLAISPTYWKRRLAASSSS
jgi:choline dehydrogenase-like flavoprotein